MHYYSRLVLVNQSIEHVELCRKTIIIIIKRSTMKVNSNSLLQYKARPNSVHCEPTESAKIQTRIRIVIGCYTIVAAAIIFLSLLFASFLSRLCNLAALGLLFLYCLDDTHCNSLLHVTHSKSSQRRIVAECLHTHRLGRY